LNKDHFDVVKEHFVQGLGEDRHQASLKMPETAIYFTMAHNQNVSSALKECETIMGRLDQEW